MRISDWSSDVCSSDLLALHRWPKETGTRVEGGSVGKGDAAAVAERLTGRRPPGALGALFAVTSDEVWYERGSKPGRGRKRVVLGKSVSVRVDIGGRRIINKNTNK